jgi:uncharacterized membrane protein
VKPEILLSRVLRIGVGISLGLIVAGTAVSFAHHPSYLHSNEALERLVHPESEPHRVIDVLRSLSEFHGQGLVMLGLLCLIATPVLRVLVSVLIFNAERDRKYVAITGLVFCLLLLSFLLGRAGG